MKLVFLTLSLFLSIHAARTLAFSREQQELLVEGFEVGNGGDYLECLYFSNNQVEKMFYSLDYLEYIKSHKFSDLIVLDYTYDVYTPNSIAIEEWSRLNVNESIFKMNMIELYIYSGLLHVSRNPVENKIFELLKLRNKKLFESLEVFYQFKLNTDTTKNRFWWGNKELTEIADERVTSFEACKDPNSEYCRIKYCQKKQLAIRVKLGSQIIYAVEPAGLEHIYTRPLQASMFYIHEWLWDHFDSADKVRKANWFLHSKKAHEMSAEEFNKQLKILGFKI